MRSSPFGPIWSGKLDPDSVRIRRRNPYRRCGTAQVLFERYSFALSAASTSERLRTSTRTAKTVSEAKGSRYRSLSGSNARIPRLVPRTPQEPSGVSGTRRLFSTCSNIGLSRTHKADSLLALFRCAKCSGLYVEVLFLWPRKSGWSELGAGKVNIPSSS